MISAILVTTAALSLIIAVRYLMVAGAAYWIFWGGGARLVRAGQLNRRPPTWPAVRHEVIASLISSPIYAFPAAVAIELWKAGGTKLYAEPLAYGWWWLPVSAAIYLVAQDAFYYWAHRAMHDPRLFGWMHRGHHKSNDPTPFASFSFDPAEALITAWFLPALTLFIPIQVYLALGVLMFMTLTAVLNHAGREVWPDRWLDHPLLSGHDHGPPPRSASQAVQGELRPLLPLVGPLDGHRAPLTGLSRRRGSPPGGDGARRAGATRARRA